MTTVNPQAPPAGEERDQRLARLLDELALRVRDGHCPDLEAVAREHPDLAEDLRFLYPAFLAAEGAARSAADDPDATQRPGPAPVPPEEFAPPLRSFGGYELLEELGRGGMGVVYKARQTSLGRTVALKMILRGDLASAADRVRFRSEAESAARLDHPNIVPVHEIGEHEGRLYFTMKYVEGTTLAQRAAQGPLPARAAAGYVLTVARAVHHAHQCGILHRDLKPSNVLLDQDDRPHVTDFGLAKMLEAEPGVSTRAGEPGALAPGGLTASGAILGTPSYMAPEQAAGHRGTLGPATDVYSLGAILYQLLAGRPPFQAPSAVDTLMLVLEQDPVPPRLLNPQADRDLEMICLKCLQKPAGLRYASAALLAGDLEAYLHDEPVSARSWSLGSFMGRMLRPTHHAAVLENWGLLWMWHSLVLLVLCALTNWMHWRKVESPYPYLALWSGGLGTWAAIFWALRRRGGPVTFVERQIAHIWAGSVLGTSALFLIEVLLGLPVLTLSPLLALIGGIGFVAKGGILSGSFYVAAAAMFVTAALMALPAFRPVAELLFGVVAGACFFFPGLKYYRQRARAIRPAR